MEGKSAQASFGGRRKTGGKRQKEGEKRKDYCVYSGSLRLLSARAVCG